MEEQRIGMMYLNLFRRWLAKVWDGMFPRGFRRSPALPMIVIALLILLPITVWILHRRGRFSVVKREIQGETQGAPPAGPRPGGMDPMVLKRIQTAGSNMPEFRSATLLPGLGMEVLQITAFVPSKGEVELLAAPSVQNIADGTTPVRLGPNDRWGAIEVPWSGLLTGILSPVGTTFRTTWRNRTIEAPTSVVGRGVGEGGMLAGLAADSTSMSPEPDGGVASAVFKGTAFDDHWASRNDVTVTVTLGPRTIDLKVMVKNVGDQPEPMGIGWHPRFRIPSGNRDNAELRLPNGDQLELADRARDIPSGKFAPAGLAVTRFQAHPSVLGMESIDESLVHLKPGLMDAGSSAEVRDPVSEIGLRMTAVSDNTRELRVTSLAGSNFVGIGMQTNYDDPLGKEWSGTDTPIATLLPGDSVEWKVRLEIFPISSRLMVGH